MKITILEVSIVFVKAIVKTLGIFLSCTVAGVGLVGIGLMIYNRKKIVKILRRISTEY